jgi:hypothetical protein
MGTRGVCPTVVTPSIPTPHSREVESEEEEESEKEKEKDEAIEGCRSLGIKRHGGRRVLLPRGSGS